MKRATIGLLLVVAVAYGGVIAWFAVFESAYVYFPDARMDATPDEFGMRHERVEIESTDGVRLICWVIPAPTDTSTFWILYLHGNAGNIARRGNVEHYAQLHNLGVNILAVDYRGYGESTGSPSEQGLYHDAEAGYNYLNGIRHVRPEHIVVYGYSLGSAVAIELACRKRIAGLIVEGAWTSLPDVGQEHYPFLPVHMMARNRFASIDKIGSVAAPKLFIHARDDEIIPIHFGKELLEAAPPPKSFLEVEGTHGTAHNVDAAVFYSGIKRFLDGLH
ncbi:MAG: alpha/beta hydrolase [Bacteroidota bacterium]